MGEVKRWRVVLTRSMPDGWYLLGDDEGKLVRYADHEIEIKRLRDALQRIVLLLEDPADAEMASEYAYQIAVDAISDHPAQKTCVYTRHHYDDPELSYDYFVTSCGHKVHEIHEIGQPMKWTICSFKGCGLPIEIKE